MRWAGLMAAMLLSGCGASVTATNPYVSTATEAVSRLALSPGGGAMGEAVAAKLTEQGFSVMPAEATAVLMQRQGLASLEMPQLGGLSFLRANGIDAVLVVRAPQAGASIASARVTVLRVSDGRAIAESRWHSRLGPVPQAPTAGGPGSGAAGEVDSSVAAQLAGDIARRLRG